MHDQRDLTSNPREPATPPPLPPRFEPRIELRIEPAPSTHFTGGAGTRIFSQKRLAVCYGIGGFVAGVVFWHAVGFWQLMHSTLFSTTPVDVSEKVAPGRFADTIDRAISSSASSSQPAGITTGTVTPASEKALARFDGTRAASASSVATNCASFVRDPATGEISSRPCSEKERELPHNAGGQRENFAQQQSDSRWPSYRSAGGTD